MVARVSHQRFRGASANSAASCAAIRGNLCGAGAAEERNEDLKLLETSAGGEDGKHAKMLVPKAIDADDADESASDDDDCDDESVRSHPLPLAPLRRLRRPCPARLDHDAGRSLCHRRT